MNLLKLVAMLPAAILTAGNMANLPDDAPLDPEAGVDRTKAENLMAWERFRIYYHGCIKAIESPDWPAPSLGLPDAGGILGYVGPLIDAAKMFLPLLVKK